MEKLNLKPTHKPVQNYYEALRQFKTIDLGGNVRKLTQRMGPGAAGTPTNCLSKKLEHLPRFTRNFTRYEIHQIYLHAELHKV
jgi:hypothetical protein